MRPRVSNKVTKLGITGLSIHNIILIVWSAVIPSPSFRAVSCPAIYLEACHSATHISKMNMWLPDLDNTGQRATDSQRPQ